MFRHFPIADGLAVMVRTPFRVRADRDGKPIPDRKTGELVHVAEVVTGGLLRSAFADQDQAGALRLKVTGPAPAEVQPGTVLAVFDAHLSTWYQARGRGNDASSAATLSAGRVQVATGTAPVMSGGLPGHDRGIAALLLSTGETAELMFAPDGIFAVDGVGQVKPAVPPRPELIGQAVTIVGARVYYVVPDAADVGRSAKAELIVRCSSIDAAAVPARPSHRKADPAPAEAEHAS